MNNISLPFQVVLTFTQRCNLRCKHCKTDISYEKELSTEEMIDLVHQLGEAKIFKVSIFGGEPLLRKDFFRIVEELRKYPIRISMNTNATLITKSLAKKLVKEYNIKEFVISLDGTKEEHEKLRGKNSFDLAVRGIKNLVFYGAKVLISTTVTRFNFKNLEDIVLLGKQLNVDKVRFNQLYYGGNARCFWEKIAISPKEEFFVSDEVNKLTKKYKDFVISSYNQYNMLKTNKPKNIINVDPCVAGTIQCSIRSDGDVIPCDNLWEVKIGNIREKKFLDIWNDNKIWKKFREPITIKFSKDSECRNCEYQFLCFKGHRCWPYFYPGGIENKKLYCIKYLQG
jgi:radical SAM protein with 4Fe4S-binding SPASM domain